MRLVGHFLNELAAGAARSQRTPPDYAGGCDTFGRRSGEQTERRNMHELSAAAQFVFVHRFRRPAALFRLRRFVVLAAAFWTRKPFCCTATTQLPQPPPQQRSAAPIISPQLGAARSRSNYERVARCAARSHPRRAPPLAVCNSFIVFASSRAARRGLRAKATQRRLANCVRELVSRATPNLSARRGSFSLSNRRLP